MEEAILFAGPTKNHNFAMTQCAKVFIFISEDASMKGVLLPQRMRRRIRQKVLAVGYKLSLGERSKPRRAEEGQGMRLIFY